MKPSIVLASVAAAALSAPSLVAGHGYMMLPKAQLASGDPTRFVSEIHGPTALKVPAGGSFSNTPQVNVDSFTKAFKTSGYSSLKAFIEKASPSTPSCGLTPAGGPAQDVPDHVEWSAFADSHVGPCEVWCDNTRVFQEDNCAGKYPQRPAKLPINKAQCANAKQLKIVWLALHSQEWQVYINCAPLKGSGNTSGGSGSATTPAVTPAPAKATTTPSNGNSNTKPAATTKKPTAPTTTKPSTNSGNGNSNNNNNDSVAGDSDADADCDEEYPVAGDDEDCEDDLPVAGDDDCDDELPVAGDDCDEDLDVAGNDADDAAGDSDKSGYNFDALQRGNKYTPGKAEAMNTN